MSPPEDDKKISSISINTNSSQPFDVPSKLKAISKILMMQKIYSKSIQAFHMKKKTFLISGVTVIRWELKN